MPPLTFNPTPVMYDARSEQRNAIALATSCGSPARRIAVRCTMRSFIFGFPKLKASVPMTPGTIALHVIPCLAPSSASVRVSPRRPAFVAGVARLTEAAERPRNGRHVHDPSPAPFLHVRPDRLGAVERAGQVHAQIPLPELRHLVGELAQVVERAGVVDEDVDGAELVDDPLHGLGNLGSFGHVALDGGRAASELGDLPGGRLRVDEALCARRLGHRAEPLGVLARVRLDLDVGDHDVGAGARERQRVGAAEPA